ncbi:hasC1, partial [Symbiodinium sp. CCMP2456]
LHSSSAASWWTKRRLGSKVTFSISPASADVEMGRFTPKWLAVWLLLQAVSFSSEAQEISIADIGSYSRCPMSVFSTGRAPPFCDTTSTTTTSSTTFSSSTTVSSTTQTTSSSTTTVTTSSSSTETTKTTSSTSSASSSTTMTASLTVTSRTHTTTSRSSTSTLSTTHTSLTSTRSSTTTATTTSTTRSSTLSTTLTSVTSTSSSITSSSSTLTTRTTTTTLTNTTTTSTTYLGTTGTTTTLTESTTSVSSTTQTATTSTATSLTTSGTSTSRTSTSITTMTLSSSTTTSSTTLTTSTITRTGTTVTGTGTSSTVSSTSSTSITTSQTTTTVLPQPCGNACPLYAISGCLNMMPGEVCVPDILVDPCVEYTTTFSLSCPQDNVDLSYVPDIVEPFPTTRCRVCGVGRIEKDEDEREGYFLADLYFGQNSVETVINEDPITEYRVYIVDSLRRRLMPQPVATVPKRPEEEASCCRVDAYRAHISTMLPAGSERFMVVPVTRYGHELSAGVTSDVIEDIAAEGPHFLGIMPATNFSFLVHTAVDVQLGDGTLAMSSRMGHEERMPCRELRLLRPGVIVVPWTSAAWGEHVQALTNVLACWTALLARDTAEISIRKLDQYVYFQHAEAMSLLRSATRPADISSCFAAFVSLQDRPGTAMRAEAPMSLVAPRSFVTRSLPRLGHNLEDHFDFAEYMWPDASQRMTSFRFGQVHPRTIELFVTGRICLFGEHSDWAGGYRRFNSEVVPGCALVCGTDQGLYARARRLLGEGSRRLLYRSSDGNSIQLDLDDETGLRETAQSPSTFAYIAGCVLELGKHFRVGGAEIVNYKSDLPIKKGLSSSAAVCVLTVRALNQLYDLKLTTHGEMDIAYRGEINTPSRCGRLDQCVAFGRRVTKMIFDSDLLSTESVRAAATIYMVVVDLCAKKDTKEILKCLNEAYPFPRGDSDRALHALLGEVNQRVCQDAQQILAEEKDGRVAAEKLGEAMTEAQRRWDEIAVPLCPHELTAPALHRLLTYPELKKYITGGKGVGSQGDGSAQLVCRSKADQEEVVRIVKSLGMEPLELTIPEQKAVRTAIVPIAGACPGIWPATKCVGPWLFPVRSRGLVKPAIAWLCEEMSAAGIEKILLVVNHTTEVEMTKLFKQREEVSVLNGVGMQMEDYDEVLLAIGKKISFVRQEKPSSIRDALLLCEREVAGEPFLLAWGDHFSRSTSSDHRSVVAQLLEAFNGRPLAAMHCVDKDSLHQTGVYTCKEPPSPLPPPLGPKTPGPVKALWPLARLAEKPTREFAEERLVTSVLPEGLFLASFGQYVLTPSVFRALRSSKAGHFTEALDQLRQSEGVFGVLIEGMRWDLGTMQTYVQCLQAQAQDDAEPPAKRSRAISPVHGLRLRTEDPENATDDVSGPRLVDATSTNPLSGALTMMTEFRFLFDEVALRGPGPLSVVRLADQERGPAAVVDMMPEIVQHPYLPGMVIVRPSIGLEMGASYELVFGPGALQDRRGNLAHSSKEYEAPGEWEHRVSCFRGRCPDGPIFGLDDFTVRVPAQGGVQDPRPPELTWALYPAPEQAIFRHENLVLQFSSVVSPHPMGSVMELCWNWTVHDVCPLKQTFQHKDMLFVGDKVIINPPEDLVPGFSYNVSIQSGVISNFEGLRATAAGQFQYTFSVLAEDVFDRSPPELVAVEVDCSNISVPGEPEDWPGCAVWYRLQQQIVGEAEKWGLADNAPPPAMPAGARFRFYFREPVQILGRNAAVLAAEPLEKEPLSPEQVPAMVGTAEEDGVLVVVPELLPGELYTLQVGSGLADLATWPEPHRFAGAALKFFTRLPPPKATIASNEGFKEAAASTSVMLQFEGVSVLADPNSDLEAELRQINPASENPDEQHLKVADPSRVFFLGTQIMLLPLRPLHPGTSYNFTLPAGVVRHFDQPFSFVFTTRPEDHVAP